MSKESFKSEIIKFSESDSWEEARLEWKVQKIYRDENGDRCVCGKKPINEICVIVNSQNSTEKIVGNSCVKYFEFICNYDKIFVGFKSIDKSIEKSLTLDAIDYAYSNGWINNKGYEFYKDIRLNRVLSCKQNSWKKKLNEEILKSSEYSVGD